MQYTIFLTQKCNLACDYCYVAKTSERMPVSTADQIIEFAFRHTPLSENINIGFFGGEPLLEFSLLEQITHRIETHTGFDPCRVKLGVATNGTLLTPQIIHYLKRHDVALTISCDGPPEVHDRFRHFPNGNGTSMQVERAIRMTLEILGEAPVNAVYRPETLDKLPETVDYFSSLGVRQIYLNPDFSARWADKDLCKVGSILESIGERYMQFYREGRPHFISSIDGKIAVLLRGGYQPIERCRMGIGEFAFTPSGNVLPCERLAAQDPREHAIASTSDLIKIGPLRNHFSSGPPINTPCLSCGVQDYCMNWCGCSNYSTSGFYNRVSPFLCASERAAIEVAFHVFHKLESELGPTFFDHLGGRALVRGVPNLQGESGFTQGADVSRLDRAPVKPTHNHVPRRKYYV